VTAAVSDQGGGSSAAFAGRLRRARDDQLVEITQFSAERVPVSLGIALDTRRMAGDQILRDFRAAWIDLSTRC
jgi:hypothetical protein